MGGGGSVASIARRASAGQRGAAPEPLVDDGPRRREALVLARDHGDERRAVDGPAVDGGGGLHGRRSGRGPEQRDLARAVAGTELVHEAASSRDVRRAAADDDVLVAQL